MSKPLSLSQRTVFICVFVLIISACATESSSPKAIISTSYPLIKSASEWNDSIFLYASFGLSAFKDQVIITDPQAARLIHLTTELDLIHTTRKQGKGPAEFMAPAQTIVYRDTIFTFDATKLMVSFHTLTGEYLGEVKTPPAYVMLPRFAIDDEFNIYMSTPRETHSIVKFNLKGEVLNRFGPSEQNYRSIRHLFFTENGLLLSVGGADPLIELFTKEEELTQSYEYGQLKDIQNAIDHRTKIYVHNKDKFNWDIMYYALIRDASYQDKKLYLLYRHHPEFAEFEDFMIGNQLLVFDIGDKISLHKKVQLEPPSSERYYFSICVDPQNNYLYAFESTTKEICKFRIN